MNSFSPFAQPRVHEDSARVNPELPEARPSSSHKVYDSPDQMSLASAEGKGASSDIATPASTELGTPVETQAPPALRTADTVAEVSDEEKLAIIQAEFGDIASLMVNADGTPGPPEELLAESNGALFKGVLIVGNLHLTTHRLVFHALQPPSSVLAPTFSPPAGPGDAGAARIARRDILHAGPMTLRRSGILRSKKRVWMELSPDMITTYPSADEAGRARPLITILLTSGVRFAPLDPEHPNDLFITYEAADGPRSTHFTADNEQSAMQWRRQFEGALYRCARQRFREARATLRSDGTFADDDDDWTMLRCCVPLDRAVIKGMGDSHGFSLLLNLEVAMDDNNHGNRRVDEFFRTMGGSSASQPMLPGTKVRTSPPGSPRRSLSLRIPFKNRKDKDGKDVPPSPTAGEPSPTTRTSTTSDAGSSSGELTRFGIRHARTSSALCGSGGSPVSPSGSATPAAPAARASGDFDEGKNAFQFLIALLREHEWFADALQATLAVAHERRYRPGAPHARVTLDIGGYDCLATDEDLDRQDSVDSSTFTSSDDESGPKPKGVADVRKAEKAAMAARVFGLREEEGIWLKRCDVLNGVVPARGHLIVTPRFICFWRRAAVGADIKYRFGTHDVKGAEKAQSFRLGYHGLVLKFHGRHDLRLDFWREKSRDEAIQRINSVAKGDEEQADAEIAAAAPSAAVEGPLSPEGNSRPLCPGDPDNLPLDVDPSLVRTGRDSSVLCAAKVLAPPSDLLFAPQTVSDEVVTYMPFVTNKPVQSMNGAGVRLSPRRFGMLTIGSRGDVQPYIALSLRLMRDGHKCVIITHDEFKPWIESYGIEHRQAGGDPTALMKLSNEHRMFSPGFFKEALGTFRQWLDELLVDSWNACQDLDVLLESPSAFAGIHIAEALHIPYFRSFTMPWTRTQSYPQAFMVSSIDMGPSFNYSTYVLYDNIIWRATSGQINRWRKKSLKLPATDQSSLSISKVPFLYNFSPAVVPKPLDWYDDITITGYWELENSDMEWTPPADLVAFMDRAKKDGKALVYIGFGSIVVPDPAGMTRAIIKAVGKADVRAIIAKGWSAREAGADAESVPLPAETCYGLDKVPHSWLFPKVQAALHHGGAGTTGASLRAGIPTLIKPWFGDQFFWAQRVTKLEAGLKVGSLRSSEMAHALRAATTDTVMIEKAARIGARIRSEHGCDVAVQAITFNIMRAQRARNAKKKLVSKPENPWTDKALVALGADVTSPRTSSFLIGPTSGSFASSAA